MQKEGCNFCNPDKLFVVHTELSVIAGREFSAIVVPHPKSIFPYSSVIVIPGIHYVYRKDMDLADQFLYGAYKAFAEAVGDHMNYLAFSHKIWPPGVKLQTEVRYFAINDPKRTLPHSHFHVVIYPEILTFLWKKRDKSQIPDISEEERRYYYLAFRTFRYY